MCYIFLSCFVFIALCLELLSCWEMKPSLPIRCFPDVFVRWIKVLFVLFCVHNLVSFVKIPDATMQLKAKTMTQPPPCFTDFCRHLLLYLPLLFYTYWWWFESERPVITNFQSISCVICHNSTFYHSFLTRLQWTIDGTTEGPDVSLRPFWIFPVSEGNFQILQIDF